jgi:tocopherol cyclase
MILSKSIRPSIFQGSLKKKRYFEGWYFKLVSPDGKNIFSIIPGISLSHYRHAFIQVINGKTGEVDYNSFHVNTFRSSKDMFDIQIGDNNFSSEKMSINLSGEHFRINGKVIFEKSVVWRGSTFSPGIMGWYTWVPFMECYHGIVSLDNSLNGILNINDNNVDFTTGRGYIEKDWGRSFPECWIWAQGNYFNIPGTSVMLSVAKIPWLRKFFIGHLCFLLHQGQVYKFATWNGSEVTSLKKDDIQIHASLMGKEHILDLSLTSRISGRIKAPVFGAMERYIKESVDASIAVRLSSKNGKEIFSGTSAHAGLEVVGNVFQYFDNQEIKKNE